MNALLERLKPSLAPEHFGELAVESVRSDSRTAGLVPADAELLADVIGLCAAQAGGAVKSGLRTVVAADDSLDALERALEHLPTSEARSDLAALVAPRRRTLRAELAAAAALRALVEGEPEVLRGALDHLGAPEWVAAAEVLVAAAEQRRSGATPTLAEQRRELVEAEASVAHTERRLKAERARSERLMEEAAALNAKLERERDATREARSRCEVLEEQLGGAGDAVRADVDALTITQAKLELEAARRLQKQADGERATMARQLHEARQQAKRIQEESKWASDELARTTNSTAGQRLARAEKGVQREETLRRRAEAEMARANKEVQMLQRKLAEAVALAAEGGDSEARTASAAEEKAAAEAAATRREAAHALRAADDKLEEAKAALRDFEAKVQAKDARIADLEVMVGAREEEVRAEGRKELLKQAAELERLRTMMAWKTKIVEDDVKFRTEAEWRSRAKVLVQEIETLRGMVEGAEMEKQATDNALREAALKLSQRGQDVELLQQQVGTLSGQLQSVASVQATAERLHRAMHEQWHSLAETRTELQREQRHFRQRRQQRQQQLNDNEQVGQQHLQASAEKGGGRVEQEPRSSGYGQRGAGYAAQAARNKNKVAGPPAGWR